MALLPETDPTGGYVLGEKIRLRRLPSSQRWPWHPGVRTSMSVGMVSYPCMMAWNPDELMISRRLAKCTPSKRLGQEPGHGSSSATSPGRPAGESTTAGSGVASGP